jgi:hypothetical protein
LIVVFAGKHGLAGLLNGRQSLWFHRAHIGVRLRCREFDNGPGFDKSGIVVDRNARELEVFQCPSSLDSIIGVAWYLFFSQEILLNPWFCRG